MIYPTKTSHHFDQSHPSMGLLYHACSMDATSMVVRIDIEFFHSQVNQSMIERSKSRRAKGSLFGILSSTIAKKHRFQKGVPMLSSDAMHFGCCFVWARLTIVNSNDQSASRHRDVREKGVSSLINALHAHLIQSITRDLLRLSHIVGDERGR